jgi:hypothetical protein
MKKRLVGQGKVKDPRNRTALQITGKLVGKYRGPSDLSTNKKHLRDFGR